MPYILGSELAVPGQEMVIEPGYLKEQIGGDSWVPNKYPGDLHLFLPDGTRILINDRSKLEVIRLNDIQGIQSDPDVRDLRQPNPADHGERAGTLRYGGRTIGLTGTVEAGDIPAVRDLWESFKGVFDEDEIDLLLHSPSEVKLYTNWIKNPIAAVDTTGFVENSAAGGLGIARLTQPGWCPAADTCFRSQGTSPPSGGPWFAGITNGPGTANRVLVSPGEIVSARAHAFILTKPASTATINMLIRYSDAAGATLSQSTDSPTTSATASTSGSYDLAVNGHVVPAGAAYAQIIIYTQITGFSEAWDYRFGGFIFARAATAPRTFDGSLPGFEWIGKAHASESYGPIDQTNLVKDHTTTDSTYWENSITAGVTINTAPVATTSSWNSGPHSIYFKQTNPDATSRNMGIRSKATAIADRLVVRPGRTYRATVDVNILQKPAVGAQLTIQWLDTTGASISTVSTTIANTGITKDVTVSGQAPATATHAYIRLVTPNTTVSGAVFEGYLYKPFFADITDFDSLRFWLFDRNSSSDALGRVVRSIPRPLMIRRVRKASSMEAPEKQNGYRYQREFTTALRAADPRIYSFDQRRETITLVGTPNYLSNVPQLLQANYNQSPNTRPPIGYTQDEWTPIGTSTFAWFQAFMNGAILSGGLFIAMTGGGAAPYGVTRYRYYRSSEGFTYQRPSVVLKAQPNGPWSIPWRSYNAPGGESSWNYVGIVLKRTATASIECRFNGDGHTQPWYPGPDPAKDLEIWIDLATGGLTKVAEFDLPYGTYPADFLGAGIPVGVSTLVGGDTHLVARIDSGNKIIFQLWNKYPGPGGVLLGEVSHQMTAGQITELGSAVSGNVGIIHGISNTFSAPISGGPAVYYLEARNDSVAPIQQNILVMGNIEVPYAMDLRGDIVNPVVTITNPDGSQHFARLLDTITDANPITLNSREGTIIDQNGLSRFSGLQPGSEMGSLKPGLNTIQLDALTWGTGPHAYMRWRDARR